MKFVEWAVVGFIMLIRLVGVIPWGSLHSQTERAVGPRFLLLFGVSVLGLMFVVFWLTMRTP